MHYQKHFARNNMTGPGVYDNNRVSGNQWPAVGSTKLANGVGWFELALANLDAFFAWPFMSKYCEQSSKPPYKKKYKLSLVGIGTASTTTSGNAKISRQREEARTLVKQLYFDQFTKNSDDKLSIESAVNSNISIAVLVSCGAIPKTKQLPRKGRQQPKSPMQHSIMNLTPTDEMEHNSMPKVICVAAVTFSSLKTCQFIHWIATTKSKVPGSDYHSWRNRGFASYLLHAVV